MISKGMIFGLILIISGLPMVIWGFTTFTDEGFNYWLQFGLTDLFFGIGILVMIKFWNRR
ncbi:Hypothetical protein Nlim_0994 [Candidatus Nitrosarchaeum limnium SFB1]|jgi:hypothetical protein|uniref:Uncharacterized protein n=1 Tax=Candidatus Nitrosarchaeum limnium SFB1 TaxID=886738 RepID=F3KKI6_9ARCH|nr:Hypothetical protein Nlim_0994 [Candidatus Nitrosarchaeum limnium SFB1]